MNVKSQLLPTHLHADENGIRQILGAKLFKPLSSVLISIYKRMSAKIVCPVFQKEHIWCPSDPALVPYKD